MYREEKGFSIAEALITLMIVSLILAAVLPVVSKKSKTSDAIWHYVSNGVGANSDVYYGASNSQSAIIGNTSAPDSSKGSRLVIVTPEDSGGDTIQRSLIDFYQKTSTGMTNIGRIAFDRNDNGTVAIGWDALISNTTGIANTAIGAQALKSNTTGIANTALGQESLRDNTFGSRNTAIGDNSLLQNTEGNYSTAIGSDSLFANTLGEGNSALGFASLRSNTEGNYNTSLGTFSMWKNETGNYNTAIGSYSLQSNTKSIDTGGKFRDNTKIYSGSYNTATGYYALANNTTGYLNTAVGYYALLSNTSGDANLAVGDLSLISNSTGTHNVANGHNSLYFNTTGSWNTAVGTDSLFYNTIGNYNTATGFLALGGWQQEAARNIAQTGSNNTANGHQSLFKSTTGSDNVALGSFSLANNSSGFGNTAIGYNACSANNTGNYNVCIGNNSQPYSASDNWQLYIDVDPDNLYANPLIGGNFYYRSVSINGALYTTSGGVSASDKRVKNVRGKYKDGLEKILAINTIEYKYKKDPTDRIRSGVIAQELQKIIPRAVVEGPGNDKYKTLLYIDSNEILFTCVNAIKQLYAKIAKVNTKVSNLEKENKQLKVEITNIRKELNQIKKSR